MVNPQVAAKSHQCEKQVIKVGVNSESRFNAHQEGKQAKPVNSKQVYMFTVHPHTTDKLYVH